MVAAVITLAGAMGMVPVAEGVERGGQAEVLHALGCPSAQGYLFSAPREAAEVERMILGGPRPPAPLRVIVCDDAPRCAPSCAPTWSATGAWRSSARPGTGRAPSRSPGSCARTWCCSTSDAEGRRAPALPAIRRAAPDARVVVLSGCDGGDRRQGARARRAAATSRSLRASPRFEAIHAARGVELQRAACGAVRRGLSPA